MMPVGNLARMVVGNTLRSPPPLHPVARSAS